MPSDQDCGGSETKKVVYVTGWKPPWMLRGKYRRLRAKFDNDPTLSPGARQHLMQIEYGLAVVRYNKIRDFLLVVLVILTFPVSLPLLLLWALVAWVVRRMGMFPAKEDDDGVWLDVCPKIPEAGQMRFYPVPAEDGRTPLPRECVPEPTAQSQRRCKP